MLFKTTNKNPCQIVIFHGICTYLKSRNFCDKRWVHIQGLSTGFDILWRPLRPTKSKFLIKRKVSLYFWGLDIWVSSTSFQKSNKGWPQQPSSERVPYISEKLSFWWSIPQKMSSIGHFGASDDQTIRIWMFVEEIGL